MQKYSMPRAITLTFLIRFVSIFNCMAYCILRKMRKLRIGCMNAQDLHKILFQCARFAQDCTSFPDAQYMHKIVVIVLSSSMRNICARLYFFCNVQYMRKICTRLYFFPQCAIYAQDLSKIVVISPMRNICTRLYLFPQCAIYAQDCTSFSNTQYMCKICARLYLFLQCPIKICRRL